MCRGLILAVNVAARLTGAEDKRLSLVVWLVVVALLPVVAAVSYHLVERPARNGACGAWPNAGAPDRRIPPIARKFPRKGSSTFGNYRLRLVFRKQIGNTPG